MLERVTVEDFAPLAGQAFVLPEPLPTLTLVRATPARRPAPPPARPGFSLLFRGPDSAPLGQGMYPLAHPAFGTLEIFLVPVGAGDGMREYEAVFN
jgi:hypothetical protein